MKHPLFYDKGPTEHVHIDKTFSHPEKIMFLRVTEGDARCGSLAHEIKVKRNSLP